MDISSRLVRFLAILTTISNAPSMYLNRARGRGVNELHLWNGSRFLVENTNNNLGTILEVFHAREYADIEKIVNRSNPIVIDIGANIGTFTVFAARLLPTAHIFSYEPESKNYSLLVQNITKNTISERTTSFQLAVGGEVGTRTLSVFDVSSGRNSLSYDMGQGLVESVTCTTLEGIFRDNKLNHCDCLKIDCEGAEYELLYATPEDILAKIDMIILEWHSVEGHTVEALEQFLVRHGFKIQRSKRFPSIFTACRE